MNQQADAEDNVEDPVARLFLGTSRDRLHQCREKIEHCLGQLEDQQIWWRADPSSNSIGNLLLHLAGNLRQWIVAGVGGADDVRDRPREFAERGPIPRAELFAQFSQAIDEAADTLTNTLPSQLPTPKRVQGFEVNNLSAVYDSVAHLSGHTQEIVFMTRLQLGDRYRFHWTPGPEHGAA
ncbi:MAG: DUF1572 family protein [Pirellulaceae bacterium]